MREDKIKYIERRVHQWAIQTVEKQVLKSRSLIENDVILQTIRFDNSDPSILDNGEDGIEDYIHRTFLDIRLGTDSAFKVNSNLKSILLGLIEYEESRIMFRLSKRNPKENSKFTIGERIIIFLIGKNLDKFKNKL
jgi:hypothetical protein